MRLWQDVKIHIFSSCNYVYFCKVFVDYADDLLGNQSRHIAPHIRMHAILVDDYVYKMN